MGSASGVATLIANSAHGVGEPAAEEDVGVDGLLPLPFALPLPPFPPVKAEAEVEVEVEGVEGVADADADDDDPLPAAPLAVIVPVVVRDVDAEVSVAPRPLPSEDIGWRVPSFTSLVCPVLELAACCIHWSAQNSANAASTDCLAGMPPLSKAFAMFFFDVTGNFVL